MSRIARDWQQSNVFSHKFQLFICLYPSNNPAHRYYLATDPVTGQLYVSDTNSRRIYSPRALSGTSAPQQNVEVVAGTGDHCLPFDEAQCGDGGPATEALLTGPKGIAKVHCGIVSAKCKKFSGVISSVVVPAWQQDRTEELKCLRRRMHFDWHERSSQSTVRF